MEYLDKTIIELSPFISVVGFIYIFPVVVIRFIGKLLFV